MKSLNELLNSIAAAEVSAQSSGIVISDPITNKNMVTISRMLNSSANTFSCLIVGESFDNPESDTMMICNIVMSDNITDMRVEGNTQKFVDGLNKAMACVKLKIVDYGFVGMKLKGGTEGGYSKFEYYIGSKPFITFFLLEQHGEIMGYEMPDCLKADVLSIREYRECKYAVVTPIVYNWDKTDADFTICSLIPLVHKTLMNRISHSE